MDISSDETIKIREISRESLEISIDRRERSIDHLIFPDRKPRFEYSISRRRKTLTGLIDCREMARGESRVYQPRDGTRFLLFGTSYSGVKKRRKQGTIVVKG